MKAGFVIKMTAVILPPPVMMMMVMMMIMMMMMMMMRVITVLQFRAVSPDILQCCRLGPSLPKYLVYVHC